MRGTGKRSMFLGVNGVRISSILIMSTLRCILTPNRDVKKAVR